MQIFCLIVFYLAFKYIFFLQSFREEAVNISVEGFCRSAGLEEDQGGDVGHEASWCERGGCNGLDGAERERRGFNLVK